MAKLANDLIEISTLGLVDDPLGIDSREKAALGAAQTQATAAQQASDLFNPFQALGQSGVDRAGFLTDPNAQFDFLQNNPLFQLAQQQGQEAIGDITKLAASRGRLSADDTLMNVSDRATRNALLASSPLIQQQAGNIQGLLNTGLNVAGNQGNLLTDKAAALAGGQVGAANVNSQATQNLLNLGAQGLALL